MGIIEQSYVITEEVPTKPWKFRLAIATGLATVGSLFYFGLGPAVTKEIGNGNEIQRSYDRLPAEIRKYDADGNRSFNGKELEQMLKDLKFEKR